MTTRIRCAYLALITSMIVPFVRLNADALPVSPPMNACSQIVYQNNGNSRQGPCYDSSTNTGACSEANNYTAYVNSSGGPSYANSGTMTLLGYSEARQTPSANQKCVPAFDVFPGTDPSDSAKFYFLARATDKKVVATGMYSLGCDDDPSKGGPHYVSWRYLKPSCASDPPGGGCALESCGVSQYCPGSPCGNAGTQYCCLDSGGFHVCCTSGSPIIIDTASEGFHLTGLADGVRFRNRPGDQLLKISWTDPLYKNAWLALDRDGNGTINALSELFGNYTPQPQSEEPNGFAALAVFDRRVNGGNENGLLDPDDTVFSFLRLWIDKNHDGISQPEELFTLPTVGLFAINLHYRESKRV